MSSMDGCSSNPRDDWTADDTAALRELIDQRAEERSREEESRQLTGPAARLGAQRTDFVR